MERDEGIAAPGTEEDIVAGAAGGRTAGAEGPVPCEHNAFRSRFLANLMNKKKEVEKTLSHLMESFREQTSTKSSDEFIEDVDSAERETSAHMHYRLTERKKNQLEKIEILIRRSLQEEEFGWCEECGERIPNERLLIVPEATCCVPCQRELEKLNNRKNSGLRSNVFSGRKNGFQWEDEEDPDEEGLSILKPDMEYMSISDLEETELGAKREDKG